jgi:ABC-type maltose transport system permease subunit
MKPLALILALLFTCSAHAQSVIDDLLASPAGDISTFAVCKTADVVTTGYALSTGRFIEKNPLIAPLVSQGIGPLALISIAVYFVLDHFNNRTATATMNAVTCPIAAHNAWLLLK